MDPVYRTPRELVEGLQARHPRARRQLHQLLAEPLARLLASLLDRNTSADGSRLDRELLLVHSLHLAETLLRLGPPLAFPALSWEAFRAALLARVARLAVEPYGGQHSDGVRGPAPLPDSPEYHSETLFLPFGRVGEHVFGGDWFAGKQLDDGTLWVFLADVTGHGYYAYLLATALPALWQRCWREHPDSLQSPVQLLAVMHELLADCLPDGVFLECTLVRLDSDGSTTVVPAGGTRLLVHPAEGRAGMVKLRGAWLGLRAPRPDEEHPLRLGPGDELVLATDGVFDQLDGHGGAEGIVRTVASTGELFAALREALDRAVATDGQKDDITMVLLRRRVLSGQEESLLACPRMEEAVNPPYPLSENGDVPV